MGGNKEWVGTKNGWEHGMGGNWEWVKTGNGWEQGKGRNRKWVGTENKGYKNKEQTLLFLYTCTYHCMIMLIKTYYFISVDVDGTESCM